MLSKYRLNIGRYFDITCKIVLDFISSNTFLYLTILWFILQAVFFALSINFGLPPDETYHLAFIGLFSDNLPLPFLGVDKVDPIIYSATAKTPFFMYHYILAFPYSLLRDSEFAFVILRFINVCMGIMSLILVAKLANQLRVQKLARNITVFLLANTAMFVFMFSAISYDNLFVLLTISGVYIMVKLIEKITAKDLLLFMSILLLGCMVKINFLPIAFSLVMVLAWKYYNKITPSLAAFRNSFVKNKSTNIFLSVVVIILGITFSSSYLGNMTNHGSPFPECTQVYNLDDCKKNQIYNRNIYIKKTAKPTNLQADAYAFQWYTLMNQRTYGIFAHEQYELNNKIMYLIYFVSLLGLFAVIRLFKIKDRLLAIILLICVFNIFVLILENYSIYKDYGRPSLAIHGRYLFGILPLIYLLGATYFTRLKMNNVARCILIVVSLSIFFVASLPTFINKADPQWYNDAAREIVDGVKTDL